MKEMLDAALLQPGADRCLDRSGQLSEGALVPSYCSGPEPTASN
jgi:hypothetical protein